MSISDGSAELAVSLRDRGPAVTFATTEHFYLQTARALTVSEANGRASIYLAALSGNLIGPYLLDVAGVHSLSITVAVGAVIGAAAFTLHERHHSRVRDAYSPEAVDRAAIVVPPARAVRRGAEAR